MNAVPYSSFLGSHLNCPNDSASLKLQERLPENGSTIAEAIFVIVRGNGTLSLFSDYTRFLAFQM